MVIHAGVVALAWAVASGHILKKPQADESVELFTNVALGQGDAHDRLMLRKHASLGAEGPHPHCETGTPAEDALSKAGDEVLC